MMKKKVFLGCAWLLTGLPAAAEAPLTLYELEYPPLTMHNARSGKLEGIAHELVWQALQQAGVSGVAGALPWKRAQLQVAADSASCLFPLTRSPKREALYRWVAVINEDRQALFVSQQFGGRINSLADLKGLRIVTLLGSSMAEWLRQRQIPFSERDTPEAAYRELSRGVADVWAVHSLVARYVVKQQGSGAVPVREVLLAQNTTLYLACNPKLPEEQARRIASAMQKLRSGGDETRLVAKYLN